MHEKKYGIVIHGRGKGKELGFPTINIKLIDKKIHINSGVYVVVTYVNNQAINGMLYVGTRPTFDLHETTIEIHLFDYNESIYEQQISFQIFHKIRDEVHFSDTNKLIEQLHQDKKMVYEYFLQHGCCR